MLDFILDALFDSVKLLPFLYLAYLFLEYLNQKRSFDDFDGLFDRRFSVIIGALLGCIPQCGFCVIVAQLFAYRTISLGTLVACFISTSDEALPMLLSNPSEYKHLLLLVVVKVLIAIIAGYLVDMFYKINYASEDEEIEIEAACDCESNIFLTALSKFKTTALFIILVNVAVALLVYFVGIERLSALFSSYGVLQIFIAAALGFIPNCAISVMFITLYESSVISFAAMIAGLCTGAGLGTAFLLRKNTNRKENFLILGYLYAIAVISGIIISLF